MNRKLLISIFLIFIVYSVNSRKCYDDCVRESQDQGMTNESVIDQICTYMCKTDDEMNGVVSRKVMNSLKIKKDNSSNDQCLKDCTEDCKKQGMTSDAIIHHVCIFKCEEQPQVSIEEVLRDEEVSKVCLKECYANRDAKGIKERPLIFQNCIASCRGKLQKKEATKVGQRVRGERGDQKKEGEEPAHPVNEKCFDECLADCKAQGIADSSVILHICRFKCEEEPKPEELEISNLGSPASSSVTSNSPVSCGQCFDECLAELLAEDLIRNQSVIFKLCISRCAC